ncbi:MAG TPA: 4'-phosphopantetheinyl transferase superfamily protein [Candidatus Saccharimonadia bacterium]|nr:4'-phosphopantetheinyl transferase superfamily protein [Candidatus Saccharimonadia bacterium]
MSWRNIPLPSRGAVGVWACDLSSIEPDDSPSPLELARAARFVKPALTRRYLASRTVLRSILARWCGESPASISIELTGFGQPYLGRHPDRFFSLTHSSDRALVACAFTPVGIDLEARAALADADAMAARVLSEDELSCYRGALPRERDELLVWSWVAKEAYLKARGVGLAIEPSHVEAPPRAGGAISVRGDEVSWDVRPIEVWPRYAGALCTAGHVERVELFELCAGEWTIRPSAEGHS